MSLKKRFLRDATIYNGLLVSLMAGSLYQNPEIWLHDYPPDIQEKYGPRSKEVGRLTRLWAILFIVIAMGYVVFAASRLKKANGGSLAFKQAFKYVYLLFFSFWTFDLVVLDLLLFSTIQPSFIVLPGTEGMAGYKDYGYHLKVSWPAVPMLTIPSAIIAWIISR
jgi:hypothetical protein